MSARVQAAILDANLVVLVISARVGFGRLATFGRLRLFVESDVDLLERLLRDYREIATTSYVLAETSNLGNKLSGAVRDEWYAALANFAVITPEVHVATSVVGELPEVARFGITDAALRKLAETHMVITLEHRLSGYLQSLNLNAINFNHARAGSF
jgi:rRNA-processing protein FCF1